MRIDELEWKKIKIKEISILIVFFLMLSTNVFAIKVTLFIDIPTYIKRSNDIIIAKALETSEKGKHLGGLCPVSVEALNVLKGKKRIGRMRIATIYPIQKDKKYLLSSIGGSAFETDFLAAPELSVVKLPKYFNLEQLESITLEEQIKIIFQSRYNQLKLEVRELEQEKESLEKALSLSFGLQAFGTTLEKILDENNIDLRNTGSLNLGRNITSYAVLNNSELFCIAYYLDDGLNCLGNKLYVFLLRKEKNKSIHKKINLETLITNRPYFHPGSIMKIDYSKNSIYIKTHKNPSAGFTLILSNELKFQEYIYGWLLEIFNNEILVYRNSQVHFAPTHYAKISIYNPHSKQKRKIYPVEPYREIRVKHIKRVKEAHNKRGKEWFRNHNHHMDPELFNSSLKDKVVINDDTNSLAFVIFYDNEDYWSNETVLKLRSFRELRESFEQYEIKIPLLDWFFISLYADIMKIKRLGKTQDVVTKLFEDDKQLQKMFQIAFKTNKAKGESWRKYFNLLDVNWENPATWKKIAKTIKVPPEFTEVIYIYQNINNNEEIVYKEILLADLKRRYGDIPISEYIKPKLLNEIFKK